jgi:DNA polymerase III delta prime subunit
LGYPHDHDIKNILETLMYKNFNDAYLNLIEIKFNDGLSLGDIITEIHNIIVNYILNEHATIKCVQELSTPQILFILDKLRQIESNHYANANENIQCGGLVGIFKIALAMEKDD